MGECSLGMEKFTLPSREELIRVVTQGLTSYARPTELASFSYDERRQLHFDRSQLKQYQPADDFFQHADLQRGLESFIRKPQDLREHLDALLATIRHCGLEEEEEKANLITWRGVLTKMLCTPFLRGESWRLNGNVLGGRIYLEEVKEAEHLTPKHKGFVYGGFKFESLCMVPATSASVPTPMTLRAANVVNNLCEFGVLFRGNLGAHRLLFGAEIDGLDATGQHYLELKTTATLSPRNMTDFQRRKLLKWWTQSFLVGIPEILVGYRNQRSWIESLEAIRVDSIPRQLRGIVQWDPQLILAFGDLLLTWLDETVRRTVAISPKDAASISCFTLVFEAGGETIDFVPGGSVFISNDGDDDHRR